MHPLSTILLTSTKQLRVALPFSSLRCTTTATTTTTTTTTTPFHLKPSPVYSLIHRRYLNYDNDDSEKYNKMYEDPPIDYSQIKIPKERLMDPKDIHKPVKYGIYNVTHDETFGDYPALKWIPYDKRDPYANWDDPIERRNYGEILHAHDELIAICGPATYNPEPLSKSFLKIGLFLGSLGGLLLLSKYVMSKKEIPLESINYDYPNFKGNQELLNLLNQYSNSNEQN